MSVSNNSPIPIMDRIQSTLFKAQCHPVIGTLPAVLKVIVSAIEIIAAGIFLLLLQTVGQSCLSKRFVEHESDACLWHIWNGMIWTLQGIVGTVTFGYAHYETTGNKP